MASEYFVGDSQDFGLGGENELSGLGFTEFRVSVLSRFTQILDKRAQQKCHVRLR